MVPALKLFLAAISTFALLVLLPENSSAQSVAKTLFDRTIDPPASEQALDDEARELLARGKPGSLIQAVRSEVLSLLSETNSCTDWFLSAEPSAREKFRSLHFELDLAGQAEILKLEGAQLPAGYYHPYVASTQQDVGPGSTITLNANGAFFRASAFVNDPDRPMDRISASSFRPIGVGRYIGGTGEARLLTFLHEFGHIVNLLPIDAGVPSAPFVSVENTKTVLRHCRSQIQAHAKHLHLAENAGKSVPVRFTEPAIHFASNLAGSRQKMSFYNLPPRTSDW
ncbi:MAG: hypothetical protein NVS9B14_00920 [Candidatus Acidiferrum sp.]